MEGVLKISDKSFAPSMAPRSGTSVLASPSASFLACGRGLGVATPSGLIALIAPRESARGCGWPAMATPTQPKITRIRAKCPGIRETMHKQGSQDKLGSAGRVGQCVPPALPCGSPSEKRAGATHYPTFRVLQRGLARVRPHPPFLVQPPCRWSTMARQKMAMKSAHQSSTLGWLPVVLAMTGIGMSPPSLAAPAAKPNVLFILADDFRPDCIAAWGNPHIKT